MAENGSISTVTFFENQTGLGVSKEFVVESNASTMTLKIAASDTFSIKIWATIEPKEIGNFCVYPVIQLPSYSLIEGNIVDGEKLYQIDLIGIDYLKIEIVSLTGTISVYGKVVG